MNGISDLPAEFVRDVLFYHVTEGRRAANSLVPRNGTRTIATLLGAKFTVDEMGIITDVFGQNASIVSADISASNGAVHVIDTGTCWRGPSGARGSFIQRTRVTQKR